MITGNAVIRCEKEPYVHFAARVYHTPEEYLEIERKAEFRSEYFQGEMFAVAGPAKLTI